jgi:hypothetical protein
LEEIRRRDVLLSLYLSTHIKLIGKINPKSSKRSNPEGERRDIHENGEGGMG